MALSADFPAKSLQNLRLIPYQQFDGPMNMAIDYFLTGLSENIDLPILRFYGWKPYCLSIGYHQHTDLINFKKLEELGFDFVRRPTGGRSIFHAEELTYSVHIPKKIAHHQKLYLFMHEIFINALRVLDYDVELVLDKVSLPRITNREDDLPCFTKSAWSEVQFKGRKLIGSAQKIYPGAILQHGSILIGNAHKFLTEILYLSETARVALEKEMERKTVCLKQIKDMPVNCDQLVTGIVNQLEIITDISLNFQDLSPDEIESAKKLTASFGT